MGEAGVAQGPFSGLAAFSMQALDLNPEQRAAVEHGEGPLLVIAGPGSGKTRVITGRIVHLFESVPGLEPQNILALTFTDKAADWMKQQVARALPGRPAPPHISTFHAFCYELLREHQFNRQLLGREDVWVFLRRRMERLGLDFYQKLAEPGAFLHELNEFFSRCQDELIEPEDFEKYVEGLGGQFTEKYSREELQKKIELARIFRNSRTLMEEAGCSSFGSLIPEAVRLFDQDPALREQFRKQFRYVLVDEFQDTNYGQVELLKRLVGPPSNITAVGDDDQAIYRFRGASHGAFDLFESAFPACRTVYLNRNYRSSKRILRVAETVIEKNSDRDRTKPKLETDKQEGQAVFLLQSADFVSEAAWVAEEVARLVGRRAKFGDIAVLYRAHNYSDLLVEEFRRRQIPFAVRGVSLTSRGIVRDLLGYLRVVHSPHDNLSLTRVLLAPRWKFPEELALEVRKQAAKDRCSLYDVLKSWVKSPKKEDLSRTAWAELDRLLRDLSRIKKDESVTKLFDRLMERLGVSFLPGSREHAYANAFRAFLEAWEKKAETPALRSHDHGPESEWKSLREFMDYFRYFIEAGGKIEVPEPEDSSQAVQMMTVHSAKGLEFPAVFILGVSPYRFPHREQNPLIQFPDALRKGPPPATDIHLQEERRLFYVAMTRAKERLYISSVTRASGKPSKFVEDLLSDPVVGAGDVERIEVAEAIVQKPARAPAPARASAGLFGGAEVAGDSVRTDVAEWAGRPPVIAPDGKLRLSASAVEDYRSCPLKFKFSHYFKVPTGPQPALTFGNIMHQCVRHYFELRRKGLPGVREMEKFFLTAWKAAGFEDEYQELAYKTAGLVQLSKFVELSNARPIPVEKIVLEEGFALDLGDVVLQGRIDQVTLLDSGAEVELIDYKTGRPRSQKDADESLQLSIYALAARRQLKMDPVRLSFYHLTDNQTVSTVRTAKDLDRAEEEVREVAGRIRALEFEPTPGYVCRRCDFVSLCPAHEE